MRQTSFSWRGLAVLALALGVGLAWTAPVLAQGADTGAIVVRVTDPDGAPLPGVAVTVQGPLGTRTEFTGADGTTRFPALQPSRGYVTTFALDGFKSVVREDLRVTVGRTITLNMTMELAAVEETITVTGESPVVDVRSTNVGSTYTDELIDYTPTASGIWAGVLDHVPGVVTNEIDVGGGESGQQATFSARGSGSDQNTYNINGANTTDPDALGASSFYYSTSSFEEVGVSTGSHDMEVQAPGVVLNMVSKSGSNEIHGAVKYFYENKSFVSDNVDSTLEGLGVTTGNPNELLSDLDMQIGGPVIKDHAWLFIDWWRFEVERQITGLPAGETDDTLLKNWTFNGTWQINQNHKVSGRYFTDRKFRGNRGAGTTTPPETAWIQDSFVDIPQIQWQGVLTPNTFADVRWSKMDMEFPLQAKDPSSPRPHPDFTDAIAPTFDFTTGNWSGPPNREVFFQRDRNQFNGSLSHYIGGDTTSHDLKIGGEFARTQSFSPDRRGYTYGYQDLRRSDAAGVLQPERVRIWNSPQDSIFDIAAPNAPTDKGENWAIFLQDSFTLNNRLTISAGFRYDRSRTFVPEQSRLDSFWAGGAALNRPDLFNASTQQALGDTSVWEDFVPRIGVIYDISGTGRTALKANFSQYSQQQGVTYAGTLNPNGIGREDWFWVDANGDNFFQLGENTVFNSGVFPGVTSQIDPDLSSPILTEWTVGLEHELFENFLASATGIYRDTNNIVEDVNIGRPYGSIATTLGVDDVYTPTQVTDPGPDGILGTADDQGTFTVFNRNPGAPGNLFLISNPNDFGFDTFQEYKGVSFVLHKRWSNNWQVLASWDIGEAKSSVAGGGTLTQSTAFDDPNQDLNRSGLTSWDRAHIIKVTGNYLIPEPIGVNFGAFFRMNSGQPLVRTFNVTGLNQGTFSVRAAAPGEDAAPAPAAGLPDGGRYDSVAILDLRAEKQLTLPGRYGVLHVYADWFNVTNTNTIWDIRELSGSRYGEVNSIVPPRVFRLGAAWDF